MLHDFQTYTSSSSRLFTFHKYVCVLQQLNMNKFWSSKTSVYVTFNLNICFFSAEKDLDTIYEVVFDEPFAGGLSLR